MQYASCRTEVAVSLYICKGVSGLMPPNPVVSNETIPLDDVQSPDRTTLHVPLFAIKLYIQQDVDIIHVL